MKERLYTWIWKVTGWIPPEWSRRDTDVSIHRWCALANAAIHLDAGQTARARADIRRGMFHAE